MIKEDRSNIFVITVNSVVLKATEFLFNLYLIAIII